MFWIYAFMLVLVVGVVVTLIWWGLGRRPGSELVELTMYIVAAGPWRYSNPSELSEEGYRNAHLDMVKLRGMLDDRPALLIEPANPRLQEVHAILASTNEYEVIPYREGLCDYGGILLGLPNDRDIKRLDQLMADSIAVLANRSTNVEHLNVILTIVPGSLAVMPAKQRVRMFTVKYHRLSRDIVDIGFV